MTDFPSGPSLGSLRAGGSRGVRFFVPGKIRHLPLNFDFMQVVNDCLLIVFQFSKLVERKKLYYKMLTRDSFRRYKPSHSTSFKEQQ